MNIFWFSPTPSHPQNAGNRARIFSLAKYFQNQGHHITFVYFAQEGNEAKSISLMKAEWDDFYLIPFSGRGRKKSCGQLWGIDDWYEQTITHSVIEILQKKKYDVVFCEYIFQSKVLELFPANCIKVIDTHDRMGDRAELLKRNGIEPDFFYTTPEQEGIALNRADFIISIQEEEAKYYQSISISKVVVIEHILDIPKWQWSIDKLEFFNRPLRIGYFGSGNSLNYRSFLKFLDNYANNQVLLSQSELILAGSICNRITIPEGIQAKLLGFVENITDFYSQIDVAINPMIDGTGLKIKTIEAMNLGVPFISTTFGSEGLPVSSSSHLASNPQEVCSHLLPLCEQNELSNLAKESISVIERYNIQLGDRLQTFLTDLDKVLTSRHQQKTLILVTDAPFWEGKMGSHQRILAICQKLKQHFQLKVFFFGSIWIERRQQIIDAGFNREVVSYKNFLEDVSPESMELPKQTSFADYKGLRRKRHRSHYSTFAQFISIEQANAVIIEYIYLAYLLDAVPSTCMSIIDTHDVMCHREYRFHLQNCLHGVSMSLSMEEEKTVLSHFDAALAIQNQEYQVLRSMLPQLPILLCPHAIKPLNKAKKSGGKIESIGFIGANSEANRLGLDWFLSQVWPVIKQLGLQLYIFGSVGDLFTEVCEADSTIQNMSSGLAQEEIYQMTDCMINPVFVGGGLKIKTLEALAFGKPIVSTVEGAVGIGEENNNGVLIAHDRSEFIDAFIRLTHEPSLAAQLVAQSQELVQLKFSPEECYGPLVEFLSYA